MTSASVRRDGGRRVLGALLGVLCSIFLVHGGHAENWRFAAIGDAPYSPRQQELVVRMLGEIAEENVDFIVHAGDLKASREPCSDALFKERHAVLDGSAVPLIYVPGDNEWTDCRFLIAGGFDPLERLRKLRQLFFATSRSLGKKTLPLEQAPNGYPELLRWRLGPVLLLTLNVPGPDNHHGMSRTPSDEFLARNPRLLDWLREGFAIARRDALRGVVVVMQANPDFRSHASGLAPPGFRELLDMLARETRRFAGQVLLIHGDTHWQRVDHPLHDVETRRTLSNFTRLETFGSPFLGWVKVIVDSDEATLFRFEVHPYPSH